MVHTDKEDTADKVDKEDKVDMADKVDTDFPRHHRPEADKVDSAD